jgi:hypothetical protein
MQTFVTGYQYGDRKQFTGKYVFETHADFDPHLPPNTVLVEPPKDITDGKEAIWDGKAWALQEKLEIPKAPETTTKVFAPEIPEAPKLPDPVIIPVPEYVPSGTPIVTTN